MTKPLNLNSNGDVAEVPLGSANQLWGVNSSGTSMSFTNGGLIGENTNSVTVITPLGGNILGNSTSAPTISNQGISGSSTYSYAVVGTDSGGNNYSVTSVFAKTISGNSLLTSTNYNKISWTAPSGVSNFSVYRMQQPSNLSTISAGTSPGAKLVNGTTMYVCNYGSGTVSVIDLSTQSVTNTVTVGTNPYCMILVGTNLYVANYGSSNVTIINTGTLGTTTVSVGSNPCSLSATSSDVFVGCSGTFYSISIPGNTPTALYSNTGAKFISSTITANYVVDCEAGTGTQGSYIDTYSLGNLANINTFNFFNLDPLCYNFYAICSSTNNDICYLVGGTCNIYCFNAGTGNIFNIGTPAALLHNIVMSPDGTRVFAYGLGNNGQPIVVVVSTSTNKILSYLNLGTSGVVYNTGTVSTSSTTATGSSTTWTGVSTTFPLQMGFKSTNPQTINSTYTWFPISSIGSNTSITLASAPSPAISSGTSYVITSILYASLTFDPTGKFLYIGQLGSKLFVVNIDTLFYMNVGEEVGNNLANPTSSALPYASINQSIGIASTGIYFSSGSTITVSYGIGKIGTTSGTSFNDQGNSSDFTYPPQIPTLNTWLSTTSPSVQFLDCTNGNICIWLPDATTCAGKEFIFPRTDTTNNIARIYPINGSQDVGGLLGWTTYNKGNQVYLKSDGITWKWVNRPTASQWGIAQLPPKKTRNCHDWQIMMMSVLANDQQIYTWGYNGYGNLAHSTTSNYDLSQPVQFDPVYPPTKGTYIVDWVSTGCNLFVLMSDGSVYAAGQNVRGQLGIGNTSPNSYLQKMTSISQSTGGIVKIWAYSLGTASPNFGFVYLMRIDGTVLVCGYNTTLNLLGNGTASDVLTPSSSGIGILHPVEIKFGLGFSSSASYQQACCCDAYGNLWFTGQNTFGNFGNGTNTNSTTWTYVTISGVSIISHIYPGGGYNGSNGGTAYTAVIDVSGNLYTCGDNSFGELGLGSGATNPTKTFTKVTTISNPVVKMYWGGGLASNGFALDNQGFLWTWGYNGNSDLFLSNTTTPQYLPNMVMANVQFFDKELYSGGPGVAGMGVVYDGNSLRLSSNSASAYSLGMGVTDVDYPSSVSSIPLPQNITTGEEKVIDLGIFNYQHYDMVFLLTDQGNLYGCGNNTNAILQCGYANYNGSNTSPVGFLKLKVT